jgi:hypothetical protein
MRRRELLLVLATGTMGARAVRAQQKGMPVIGYLNPTSPGVAAPATVAFRQGLGEAGYICPTTIFLDPATDIISAQHFWTGRLERLGPVRSR